MAAEVGVPFAILDVRASDDAIRTHLARRVQAAIDATEAYLAVLELQRSSQEPLDADERLFAMTVDSEDACFIPSTVQELDALLVQ